MPAASRMALGSYRIDPATNKKRAGVAFAAPAFFVCASDQSSRLPVMRVTSRTAPRAALVVIAA